MFGGLDDDEFDRLAAQYGLSDPAHPDYVPPASEQSFDAGPSYFGTGSAFAEEEAFEREFLSGPSSETGGGYGYPAPGARGAYTPSSDDIQDYASSPPRPQQSEPIEQYDDDPSPFAYSASPLAPQAPSRALARPPPPAQPQQPVAPLNKHGIKLVPIATLPDLYRSLFKFPVFNAVQSTCFETAVNSDDNMVVSAPTGCGKTAIFELALVRLLCEQAQGTEARGSKVVYMAPTKSLCAERARDWSAKLGPLGVVVAEVTGDQSQNGRNLMAEAKNADVIITTPEKLDSISRRWADHAKILERVRLLMIDEVHILNESRGSTLEVLVSRMKLLGKGIRFVAVSATVPNVHDVGRWLRPSPTSPISSPSPDSARVFTFPESFRPVPITRHVYAFPSGGGRGQHHQSQNHFQFEAFLTKKTFEILARHVEGKPALVFCATRRSVASTADAVMKDFVALEEAGGRVPWAKPRGQTFAFKDKKLQTLAAYGLGLHHAGLDLQDRRQTEQLFLNGTLRVVFCTSTLAVGVNLPCRTVVIKGTHYYAGAEGWAPLGDLDVLQMIGRAGRPQFDNVGTAVIMTDKSQQAKYDALASGRTILESSLHMNLQEHLNAEIFLGTITSVPSALKWLQDSFLYIRIAKNPRHYQNACAFAHAQGQTWEQRLEQLVRDSVGQLEKFGLVKKQEEEEEEGETGGEGEEERGVVATELGRIMSRGFLRFKTFQTILALPPKAKLSDLIQCVASANEFAELVPRQNEKKILNKLREHQDIRFPPAKIATAADKVRLLMQATLAGISLEDYKADGCQPVMESLTIFRHAPRIARAIGDVAFERRDGAVARAALELSRSLNAKAWEDRSIVLRQIDHIGAKSLKVLIDAGITSIASLREQEPSRIELLLNRNPPFGNNVIALANAIPQLKITVEEQYIQADGKSPVLATLRVELAVAENAKLKTKTRSGMIVYVTSLLTSSDDELIDFRRIPVKALVGKLKDFTVTVNLTRPSQRVIASIACEEFAGVHETVVYRPKCAANLFPVPDTHPPSDIDALLEGLEDDPSFFDNDDVIDLTNKSKSPAVASTKSSAKSAKSPAALPAPTDEGEPERLANGNFRCSHRGESCVAGKCSHKCCSNGVKRKPRKSRPAQASASVQNAPASDSQEDMLASPSPAPAPKKRKTAAPRSPRPRTSTSASTPKAPVRALNDLHAKPGSPLVSRNRVERIAPSYTPLIEDSDDDNIDLSSIEEVLPEAGGKTKAPKRRLDHEDSSSFHDSELDALLASAPADSFEAPSQTPRKKPKPARPMGAVGCTPSQIVMPPPPRKGSKTPRPAARTKPSPAPAVTPPLGGGSRLARFANTSSVTKFDPRTSSSSTASSSSGPGTVTSSSSSNRTTDPRRRPSPTSNAVEEPARSSSKSLSPETLSPPQARPALESPHARARSMEVDEPEEPQLNLMQSQPGLDVPAAERPLDLLEEFEAWIASGAVQIVDNSSDEE